MDEEQLGRWLAAADGPLLRHETADGYAVPSDGDDYSRYLSGASEPSPEVGAGWRKFVGTHDVWRVRVLNGTPSRFVSFECEWQYTLNQRAGERIRVLDTNRTSAATNEELWVADGAVALMRYRSDHTFDHAEYVEDRGLVQAAWQDYINAQSFPVWWAEHPQYHRAAWLPQAALSGR